MPSGHSWSFQTEKLEKNIWKRNGQFFPFKMVRIANKKSQEIEVQIRQWGVAPVTELNSGQRAARDPRGTVGYGHNSRTFS